MDDKYVNKQHVCASNISFNWSICRASVNVLGAGCGGLCVIPCLRVHTHLTQLEVCNGGARTRHIMPHDCHTRVHLWFKNVHTRADNVCACL